MADRGVPQQITKLILTDPVANRAQDQSRDAVNSLAKTYAVTQQIQNRAAGVSVQQNVSKSVTFNAQTASHFTVTLTGDASASIVNVSAGQVLTFVIVQDATGAHAFAWPAYVNGNSKFPMRGAGAVGATANKASCQTFRFDGTTLWATSAIQTGI